MQSIASSYPCVHPCTPTAALTNERRPLGALGVGRLPYVGTEVRAWP